MGRVAARIQTKEGGVLSGVIRLQTAGMAAGEISMVLERYRTNQVDDLLKCQKM